MTKRGRRQRLATGYEFDWLYGRNWYHWQPGEGRAIKRAMNKRLRSEPIDCEEDPEDTDTTSEG